MPAESKRRDTPSEGMPAIQHVTEAGDHFVVTYADGKSATVPKEGLKADTLAHIQGMAHGGEVRALAGGIRVDSAPDAAFSETEVREDEAEEAKRKETHKGFPASAKLGLTPTEDDVGSPRVENYADGGVVDFQPLDFTAGGDAGTQLPPVQFTPGGAIFPSVSPDASAATAAVTDGAPASPDGSLTAKARELLGGVGPLLSTTGLGPVVGLAQAALGAPEPVQAPPHGIISNAGLPPVAAPQQQAQQPATAPQVPGWGGSGALGELNKGLAEQRAGLDAQAEVEKQRDAALMDLHDRGIAQMQALQAQQAEQYEAHQRRGEDLFQAVLNSKVDPNRVWANADVGQRMAAGIGILLSGIGQGLAGGPNMALQQINLTIDRDIAAQRDNLEKNKGLLSYYLQQGRDMLSAQQLAKADLKDMYAAQIMGVSARFGGAEAAARAQMAGGQLRTEAAGKRQQIIANEFQMKAQRTALGNELEKTRIMSQFAAQAAAGKGDAGMWEMMPKDVRERRVRLPSGGWGLASNVQQANDLTKGFQAADEMKRGLQRFTSLLESGHPKIWTRVGGDMSAAEELYGMLTAKLKEAQKLGAMSESDYSLIEKQIPDISSWRESDAGARQKLAGLGRAIDDAIASQLRVLGIR